MTQDAGMARRQEMLIQAQQCDKEADLLDQLRREIDRIITGPRYSTLRQGTRYRLATHLMQVVVEEAKLRRQEATLYRRQAAAQETGGE